MTTDLEARLTAILDTIDEPRKKRAVLTRYRGVPEPSRLDALRNLEDERPLGEPAALARVLDIINLVHPICGRIEDMDYPHMPAVHAALRHTKRSVRSSSVPLLIRMRCRAFIDAGYTPPQAKTHAEALIRGTAPVATRGARRPRRRLSRKQRLGAEASIPVLFGQRAYLLVAVLFLVALLIENGGRWEGFQYARIRDIKWRGSGADRVPILIKVDVEGKRHKRRIVWRTRHCGKALMALLAHHPCKDWERNPDAILLTNPWTETGFLDEAAMDAIMGRITRHVDLTWTLGPNAFRVHYMTSQSVNGISKARIRRNVGHVPNSPVTATYIRYDHDDLVALADQMGFTQGQGDAHCRFCQQPVPRAAPSCRHCKAWLLDEDPATYRVNALARLGRAILKAKEVAP